MLLYIFFWITRSIKSMLIFNFRYKYSKIFLQTFKIPYVPIGVLLECIYEYKYKTYIENWN